MDKLNNIVDTAEQASTALSKEIENANRIAQASKDLSEKWAALAEQEKKRLDEEETHRKLKEDIVTKISKLTREDLNKLKDMVKEV